MQRDNYLGNNSSKGHLQDKSLLNNNFLEIMGSVHKRHILGCAQKSEKIWCACILVTDIMRVESLVPGRILQVSEGVHVGLYELTREHVSEDRIMSIISLLDELSSLIRIASITEDISIMNATILSKEIGLLSEQIRRILFAMRANSDSSLLLAPRAFGQGGVRLDPKIFQSEYFDSARFGEISFEDKKEKMAEVGGHFFEAKPLVASHKPYAPIKTTLKDIQKDSINDTQTNQNDTKGQKMVSDKKDLDSSTSSDNKLARRTEVLKIIQTRKSVSIQDISSYINDCSIKTLQRILGDLVSDGAIEKRGNKRWTTYHLVG